MRTIWVKLHLGLDCSEKGPKCLPHCLLCKHEVETDYVTNNRENVGFLFSADQNDKVLRHLCEMLKRIYYGNYWDVRLVE